MLESAIEASDNTAANRLLALVGGPPGYTAYLRGLGDATTRLDRVELALNSNQPGDARDTTTPRAMVEDMRQVLVSNRLSSPSRAGCSNGCVTARPATIGYVPGSPPAG